jgi:hypothetical protein
MYSVLQRASAKDVRLEPFPHLVIHNALPDDLCDELISNYPSLETLEARTDRNNFRWSYSAHKVENNSAISPLWRDFIRYHASPAFYNEIADLFADAIVQCYPHYFPNRESVVGLRAGIRGVNDYDDSDILLDAQISGNTPVSAHSSVRTTHIDRNDKLFSALLYLRPDKDQSTGGDLTISRFKPALKTPAQKRACFHGAFVDDQYTEVVQTIPYAKNTLIMFINSIDSLHGVTVREPTPHSRLFLNLVGEVNKKLYPVTDDTRPSLLDRIRRHIALRS